MKEKKFILVLILVGMLTILSVNSIILLSINDERIINKIREEIQVNDVKIIENKILVELDVNGKLNYYCYQCK